MGYLDNYNTVRNSYKKYLTGSQTAKLLDKSREYSRLNAGSRVAAAGTLRTGFRTGYRGLQNIGMQNSGEVERLKRTLGNDFQNALAGTDKAERAALVSQAEKYARAARRYREQQYRAALAERLAREMIRNSGTRGLASGAGRYYRTAR